MEEALKKKIVDEINKSGFPLELEVSALLRDKSWLTYTNVGFQDDLANMHEIDIKAVKFAAGRLENISVGINLIIECKKTEKYPWVFFDEGYNPLNLMGILYKADCYSDKIAEGNSYKLLTGCMNSPLSSHYYNDPDIPIAKAYFEAFKSPNEPTSIYKAVLNIFHAKKHFHDWILNSKRDVSKNRVFLNHFVVVLDGTLSVARKNGDSFEVESCQHILLNTIDTIAKQNITMNNEIIIDIISKDYVSTYIDKQSKILKNFYKHIAILKKSTDLKI